MSNQVNINEKIAKLNDEEVIKEINNINKKQLSNIGSMAYIELFNRNLYLRSILNENKELVDELLAEESKFKEVYEQVEEKVLDLSKIVDTEKLNENLNIDDLKSMRVDIVKLLRTLTAYSTELSFAHDISKDLIYKKFIRENTEERDKVIDQQKFFDAVSKFVMEDPTSSKNRIMDITNVLPMRITKAKYYDIISGAFKRNLNYSSKRHTDVILSRGMNFRYR